MPDLWNSLPPGRNFALRVGETCTKLQVELEPLATADSEIAVQPLYKNLPLFFGPTLHLLVTGLEKCNADLIVDRLASVARFTAHVAESATHEGRICVVAFNPIPDPARPGNFGWLEGRQAIRRNDPWAGTVRYGENLPHPHALIHIVLHLNFPGGEQLPGFAQSLSQERQAALQARFDRVLPIQLPPDQLFALLAEWTAGNENFQQNLVTLHPGTNFLVGLQQGTGDVWRVLSNQSIKCTPSALCWHEDDTPASSVFPRSGWDANARGTIYQTVRGKKYLHFPNWHAVSDEAHFPIATFAIDEDLDELDQGDAGLAGHEGELEEEPDPEEEGIVIPENEEEAEAAGSPRPEQPPPSPHPDYDFDPVRDFDFVAMDMRPVHHVLQATPVSMRRLRFEAGFFVGERAFHPRGLPVAKLSDAIKKMLEESLDAQKPPKQGRGVGTPKRKKRRDALATPDKRVS